MLGQVAFEAARRRCMLTSCNLTVAFRRDVAVQPGPPCSRENVSAMEVGSEDISGMIILTGVNRSIYTVRAK